MFHSFRSRLFNLLDIVETFGEKAVNGVIDPLVQLQGNGIAAALANKKVALAHKHPELRI